MTNDDDEVDSADEALCEMLGISSLTSVQRGLEVVDNENDEEGDSSPTTSKIILPNQYKTVEELISNISEQYIQQVLLFDNTNFKKIFAKESICRIPYELSISTELIRRMTDEVVWNSEKYNNIERSYETIQVVNTKHGTIAKRQVLTRLENVCQYHPGWNMLCTHYIQTCVSTIMGQPMVLYKDKLNIKPPGGSGFAPHLDTPSLRNVNWLIDEDNENHTTETTTGLPHQDNNQPNNNTMGPQTFVTVMIAIDNMTHENGCLQLVYNNQQQEWNETNACTTIQPQRNGNPDSNGRAGEIPQDVSSQLHFTECTCTSGTIVLFNGWTPHKSNPNQTLFPRRAMFVTYNPANEGNYYTKYYQQMKQIRERHKKRRNDDMMKQQQQNNDSSNEIDPIELSALASIPSI